MMGPMASKEMVSPNLIDGMFLGLLGSASGSNGTSFWPLPLLLSPGTAAKAASLVPDDEAIVIEIISVSSNTMKGRRRSIVAKTEICNGGGWKFDEENNSTDECMHGAAGFYCVWSNRATHTKSCVAHLFHA